MATLESDEVRTSRYATDQNRKRFHACMQCSPNYAHDDMPRDFYVPIIHKGHQTLVVDTGPRELKCIHRIHDCIRSSIETHDVRVERVDDVLFTKMHWNQADRSDRFTNAQVHLPQAEMFNVMSQNMSDPLINIYVHIDDSCTVVQHLYEKRVTFHEHSHDLTQGVSIDEVGGYSHNTQIVLIYTARGWIFLASGAWLIISVDLPRAMLGLARSMGTNQCVFAEPKATIQTVQKVKDLSRGGVDFAFEAAGSNAAFETAYAHAPMVFDEKTVKDSYMVSCVPLTRHPPLPRTLPRRSPARGPAAQRRRNVRHPQSRLDLLSSGKVVRQPLRPHLAA